MNTEVYLSYTPVIHNGTLSGADTGGGGGAVILRFQNSFLTALKGKKT